MKMYKSVENDDGDQEIKECNVDLDQRGPMKANGWSSNKPEVSKQEKKESKQDKKAGKK